jgi:hypothetical protein
MKNGIAAPLLDIGSIFLFIDLSLVRVEPPSVCDMKEFFVLESANHGVIFRRHGQGLVVPDSQHVETDLPLLSMGNGLLRPKGRRVWILARPLPVQ